MEKVTLKAIGNLIEKKLDQRFSKFEQKLEPRFKRIEGTLDWVCVTVADLVVSVGEIKVDLADVKETVHHHSTTLDWFVKKYKNFDDERTIVNYRMGKFENTLRYVADESKIDIEDKLD